MDISALDTLDSLGAGKKIIALPQSNLPTYLTIYKNSPYLSIDQFDHPNLELIKENQADLIITGDITADVYHSLAKIAPVLSLNIDTQHYRQSIEHNINLLAILTQKPMLAKEYLNQLNTQITDVNQKAKLSSLTATVARYEHGQLILAENSIQAAFIHELLGVKRVKNASEAKPTSLETAQLNKNTPVILDNQYFEQHPTDLLFIVDVDKATNQSNDTHSSLTKLRGTQIIYLEPVRWVFAPWGIDNLKQQVLEISTYLK
ncbi:ABC transporter substrate-binding protein [Utexia brackfieldae]|uniref:ABC transporter substrate-binding protein n=1 Tax=Utexia brackfieldae TaxID=3074108 RepID=UPI00370D67C3